MTTPYPSCLGRHFDETTLSASCQAEIQEAAVVVYTGGPMENGNCRVLVLPEPNGLALLILAVVFWERRPWRRR